MIVNFNHILRQKGEFDAIDRTKPENVAALLVHAFSNYDPDRPEDCYQFLQFLLGENQDLSNLAKQSITDRMMQNEKFPYIGNSYFQGATPENDYVPVNYGIEVEEDTSVDLEEGTKKMFLKSGGADTKRPILLRLGKDGKYYVWSDSYMGLLADIRSPESKNPWI